MPLHLAFMILLTFQSTPSAWRETIQSSSFSMISSFQSTPSAWRETFQTHVIATDDKGISIHSLRMEGDDVRG